MKKISMLIADDQSFFPERLKTTIEMESDMEVIATAGEWQETLEKAINLTPDIILIDAQMLNMDCLESLQEIKKILPDTKIIIFTSICEEEYIVKCLANGADGFITKDMKYDKVISYIRDVALGQMVIPNMIAKKLAQRLTIYNALLKEGLEINKLKSRGIHFSEREKEVAILLAKGYSNKNIAKELYISEGTVKNYISEIYSKLGVKDRTKAIVILNEIDLL